MAEILLSLGGLPGAQVQLCSFTGPCERLVLPLLVASSLKVTLQRVEHCGKLCHPRQ